MKFTSEISLKIRTAIKVKLAELGNDVYEELPDYIMVMVANKKSEEQMTEDLSLFLGDNTQQFTSWLHSLLSKLVASVSSVKKQASASTEEQNNGATATHSDSESEYEEDASYAIPSSDEASKGVMNPDEEEHSDGQKSDSSSVDHADSSIRGSNNEPSLTFDSDNLNQVNAESTKTDNGAHEEVFRKRKLNPETRKFRVKSRKLDAGGDYCKSNTVAAVSVSSSSPTVANNGTDESESEKETHSDSTIIKRIKAGSKASEVSSSVQKTVAVEGENLVQSKESKEKDSEENVELVKDEEKMESELELKQL